MFGHPMMKPGVFKQKTPCSDCPFRKVGGTRHGPEAARNYIRYFVTYPGTTFPCHKSVPKSDPRTEWSEWQDGQVLCSGGMIFALKFGQMNLLMHEAIRLKWYDPAQHSESDRDCVFDSIDEMVRA